MVGNCHQILHAHHLSLYEISECFYTVVAQRQTFVTREFLEHSPD